MQMAILHKTTNIGHMSTLDQPRQKIAGTGENRNFVIAVIDNPVKKILKFFMHMIWVYKDSSFKFKSKQKTQIYCTPK